MPSESHINLGHIALTWLENKATARGSRSCVEVTLGEGYISDAAAICGLQLKWHRKFGIPTALYDDYSFIFESKVSKSDFDKTFKRKDHLGDRLIPRANFHFVVTPRNVVIMKDIPESWGWLEESGTGLSIKKMAPFHNQTQEHLHEFAYRILRYTTAWKKYNVERFNSQPHPSFHLIN